MAGYLSIWRGASANATRKSDILDVVKALRERVPWQLARRIMEVHGISTGHGWENTIADLEAREVFKSVDLDGLYDAFVQHACCGEKSVTLFDADGVVDALRDKLLSSLHLARLPQPQLKPALAKSDETEPELLCVQEKANGLYGIFGAVRGHDEQTPIKVENLPQSARAALPAGVDELIAIRTSMFQSYGAIWVPSKGSTVELRSDHFVNHSQQSLAEFHQKMYAQLHILSGSKSILSPQDLFSAVKNLYDADDEGIVMELAFATTTGSVKHERMRSKDSLRKEIYHVGGKEALATEIEPFKLGVRWVREYPGSRQANTPELMLDGHLAMVGSKSPGLTKFSVRKAAGYDDYDWVRDKLIEYV